MSPGDRAKNRWCSFRESAGKPSKAAVLIVAPRFTGSIPRKVNALAPGDVQIAITESASRRDARAIGSEIEGEAILGDCRGRVDKWRIDARPKVDRCRPLGPLRIPRSIGRWHQHRAQHHRSTRCYQLSHSFESPPGCARPRAEKGQLDLASARLPSKSDAVSSTRPLTCKGGKRLQERQHRFGSRPAASGWRRLTRCGSLSPLGRRPLNEKDLEAGPS